MSGPAKIAIRAVALTGDEASALLTEMLRRLAVANESEPLPPGFFDHREDLKSARATIDRVSAALAAATTGEAVRA